MSKFLIDFNVDQKIKNLMHIAMQYAKDNVNPSFGPPHVLKALLHKDIELLPTLKSLSKDVYFIEEWAEVRIEHYVKSAPKGDPEADDDIETLMGEANDIKDRISKDSIDAICVLAALVTPGVVFSFDQLKSLPLKREELIHINPNAPISAAAGKTTKTNTNAQAGVLQHYCVHKTNPSNPVNDHMIIGRDSELRMIAEVLCRKSKPNVIITGDPGVGKSALINGFVDTIIQKKVPEILEHAQVFEMEFSSLVAGANYKGEVEDRLKNIIEALKTYEKPILFIDELHQLVDKNGPAGGAANILKAELSKGEITIIATTTFEGYKKFIENDEAFNRRFELIKLDEPDETTAYYMLQEVIPSYETHHSIKVPNIVYEESIRLAKRYIKNRKLPDAAIELIDSSMAALRMLNDSGLDDIATFKATVEDWKANKIDKTIEDWKYIFKSFMSKISPILSIQLTQDENVQALDNKEHVIQSIDKVIEQLKVMAASTRDDLQVADVASIVSSKTGIPIGKLQAQEQERLLNMEHILKNRVVGQDQAVKSIADAILESRSGLSKPGQPIGSFFFLGPTGTGKTELAKSLAEFLFQDESFMIRFDMSEFKEEHSAALLYGAPPGYVGYEEGGLLVNKIRQQPYAVVLFDEIEKAHPSVFDVFLQIMDEGKLHDKLGKTGDFSNAVVIFTSNIGSKFVVDKFNKNEVPASQDLIEVMSNHFRPEFLGRLSEVVPFAPMQLKTVRGILDIQLKSLHKALEKQGIQLKISDAAKDILANQGFTPAYGARPLGAVIRNQLRRPLSKKIISGEIKTGAIIELEADNDNLVWK